MKEQTIMYKGVEIPAKMTKFGDETPKLIPISTNRYVLYGIPKPRNIGITDEITAIAKSIIKTNKDLSGARRSILAKYIREGSDGLVLKRRHDEDGKKDYFVSKGDPIGLLVAFVHNDKVLIGWSKYLEGKELVAGKKKKKEPLVFAKRDALLIAISRGLVDKIIFIGSNVYTKEKVVIPKSIVKALGKFEIRSRKYFKKDIYNILIKEKWDV